MSKDTLPTQSSGADITEFLRKAKALSNRNVTSGRLIFALDATASRQPTWDRACQIQAEMFTETNRLGGLAIQLVWYRGFGEFSVGPWLTDASMLLHRMNSVFCLGGLTQIRRVLDEALAESRKHKINALVFVGDCVEEDIDVLCDKAGQLGLLGVPVFVFHEGGDAQAARVFRQIARLSGGAYCCFDAGSAHQLRELLSAVAVYAAGGRKALEDYSRRKGGWALRLTHQFEKK